MGKVWKRLEELEKAALCLSHPHSSPQFPPQGLTPLVSTFEVKTAHQQVLLKSIALEYHGSFWQITYTYMLIACVIYPGKWKFIMKICSFIFSFWSIAQYVMIQWLLMCWLSRALLYRADGSKGSSPWKQVHRTQNCRWVPRNSLLWSTSMGPSKDPRSCLDFYKLFSWVSTYECFWKIKALWIKVDEVERGNQKKYKCTYKYQWDVETY